MRELIQNVIQWGNDRNIIQGSTATKQLEKTAAELIELAIEVGREEAALDDDGYIPEDQHIKTASELGDVVVTLILVSASLGFSLEDALKIAYEKIKDRKGKMIDGKFVKEADLG